ncbi:MAG: toprim domain-containing protein, partial [Sphingobacteriia bacterium]|nr:toprim domain-containing protein [Sphingobacteriia bacterium]
GGDATFFTGDYEKYSWTKIFDPKLGGYEMLALYGEAIVKLNQNPNIPQLFRDIFKNAYLPYRDPETLKMFLKVINEFHYDHSEKLGDAFEYLLSVLGSQGDAGQFRTPRHIIDFMVAIMQPKKDESICDPACGTAGFLISSYKHILNENTKKNKGDLLTPDDRKKLINNFVGYDISSEMVRLSLVNMYLHGFTTPKIFEYDSLTYTDRWGDTFDIIMANPPFMSPKGGIRPHKKFAMQANRSEVLFVDYIMEHINPTTGRAAVIVPEGIIFQSATAYKALRKLLVEKKFSFEAIKNSGLFYFKEGETNIFKFRLRFRMRMTIPIRDIQDRIVGFSARFVDGITPSGELADAKYINSPETPIFHKGSLLFGINHARKFIDDVDEFWLVEGQIDAMRCWERGLNTAIAPQGTAITDTQLSILRRYSPNVNCLLDGDEAGLKEADRII